MSTAYVAQYIAAWTYSGGLPLPCVSQVTRMRHPRKSTASIGAKLTVSVAVFRMSWIGRLSYFTLKTSAAEREGGEHEHVLDRQADDALHRRRDRVHLEFVAHERHLLHGILACIHLE